jgi:hypothetical protein
VQVFLRSNGIGAESFDECTNETKSYHQYFYGGRVNDRSKRHSCAAVAYIDGATIRLKVSCRTDAGRLDEQVPYGLAVTLEIAEALNVPIYPEVAERINLLRASIPTIRVEAARPLSPMKKASKGQTCRFCLSS